MSGAYYEERRQQAVREIAAVEQALGEGYPPPGMAGDNTVRGAVRIAADRLNLPQQTLFNRVGNSDSPGTNYRRFNLAVDWSKYQPSETPAETADDGYSVGRGKPPIETRFQPGQSGNPRGRPIGIENNVDALVHRRIKDENKELRKLVEKLQQRVIALEDVRADVLGLRDMPPTPVSFPQRDPAQRAKETVVLLLSDLHWGETVSIDAMDGLNSFNLDIARARLARWTMAVCDLLTEHWSGDPPERVVLILGGDLISGGIHPELAKTDALRPLPAVRDVADHLRESVLRIRDSVDCPLDLISLPGNHSRTTIKPESKEAAETSYDILVSDFLEMGLRDERNINFTAPTSPDALFSVYGWRVLASHGDKIGSRGGQGFVGPAATAARGFKKLIADYAKRGIHLDLIFICHFHTPLMLEEGFVNGSLPGPTEYSRDGRFVPHPAQQLMIAMHPRHKITQVRWIEVGDPSEGSLYEPPPPDRPLRERFR